MPLTTLAATVTSAGISAPTFEEVLTSLQESYQGIFGADVYLAPDSQDGQFLALLAKGITDGNNSAVATYNNFSPQTSQGEGLSSTVKLNGLQRNVATNSTVDVTLVGQVGITILNGIVADGNNTHKWNLPSSVTIPGSGTITVTATCQDMGAIEAPSGTVTQIITPTLGWQTVTNPTAAVTGAPVETDAALRRRQAKSTALPAKSALGALISGIADLTGVTEVEIHENYTDTTDAQGVPEHCIATIVVGGDVNAIAQTIAAKKTPGCNTFGNISVLTTDPDGLPITINFSRPSSMNAAVVINVHPLAGYSSDVAAAQVQRVQDYIGKLDIAQPLYFNRLWVPAQLAGSDFSGTFEVISMTVNATTADLTPAYNQRVVCTGVTINQV